MYWIGRLTSLMREHGFTRSTRQGLVGYARHAPDGTDQRLDVFHWSNPVVADQHGWPRSYLVACPSLDGITEVGRWKIPLVEWPSADQPERPWGDVAKELADVIITPMNLPSPDAHEWFAQVDDLYAMPQP